MGGAAPAAPDYQKLQSDITTAGAKQTANNRLNTSNPFASQTFNPDGSTSTQFTGALGQAAGNLSDQAAAQYAKPMDPNQFGTLGTGDSARDQAITGAYNQATSRLDPQWDKRMAQSNTQLLNQGLDPSSEAYKNQSFDLGQQRNDAYGSAMNGAIAQGTAAGNSAFQNNLQSRQQAISEALGQRNQPMQDMKSLQGLLGQPGYGQDNTSLGASMGSAQFAQQAYKQQQDAKAAQDAATGQTVGGIGSALGAGLGIASMFF